VEVRILGPVEVWVDGKPVDLGVRQRALLALLVLNRGEVVSTDRLIDELWPQGPPPTAAKVLQNLVSQLRRALGPELDGAVVTRPPGYALQLAEGAVDANRFERLAAEGRRALESDPAEAADRLRDALALWHGAPLAEFAYEPFARAEIARLDELRQAALEDRIDADLRLGRHAALVPELETLVAARPLRERLLGQQMLALYRSGRQADALATYRNARTAFREELGLEPSLSLRQLEQAILAQDLALGKPTRLPGPPVGRRRLGCCWRPPSPRSPPSRWALPWRCGTGRALPCFPTRSWRSTLRPTRSSTRSSWAASRARCGCWREVCS
jgi:SARP family transcriptional regulator, regulator of embCAB operon